MVLSFVPSSLLLGVTTHISTDIAAVPLLWVLPLALYLATFVLTFASREIIPHRWLVRALPALILCCLLTILLNGRMSWLIPLHVITFFASAMVCHRELAHRRPSAQRLTEFYLWMSFGGMLGGVFNSLLAPQLFSGILRISPAARAGRTVEALARVPSIADRFMGRSGRRARSRAAVFSRVVRYRRAPGCPWAFGRSYWR
jgi:hypothetical protein